MARINKLDTIKEEPTIGQHCELPVVLDKTFPPGVYPDRMEAILVHQKRWANGTKLRYYLFPADEPGLLRHSDETFSWVDFSGNQQSADAVRRAFQTWKNLGIGLDFEEVYHREEAEIRIGFLQGNGSWSYIGRDILSQSDPNQRTMNFGWQLSNTGHAFDTALHEIGHTLGLPHEHQNPQAGIVWD
ncbi:matrixin family metalloprotease, partial [Alphaproteobacteria bacterium]|nr:matrixin family metalloprotease [Alphaproteobacteria bacterium]